MKPFTRCVLTVSLLGLAQVVPLRAADATAAVDRILADLVKTVKSPGSSPGVPSPPTEPGTKPPNLAPAAVPPADPREDWTRVLLGHDDERFWGANLGDSSFDLRFGRHGKAWTYTRRLGPDGSLDNDQEPQPVKWEWRADAKMIEVTDASSRKAGYRLVQGQSGQPSLELGAADPSWSERKVLRRRKVELGFYGSVFSEWNDQ